MKNKSILNNIEYLYKTNNQKDLLNTNNKNNITNLYKSVKYNSNNTIKINNNVKNKTKTCYIKENINKEFDTTSNNNCIDFNNNNNNNNNKVNYQINKNDNNLNNQYTNNIQKEQTFSNKENNFSSIISNNNSLLTYFSKVDYVNNIHLKGELYIIISDNDINKLKSFDYLKSNLVQDKETLIFLFCFINYPSIICKISNINSLFNTDLNNKFLLKEFNFSFLEVEDENPSTKLCITIRPLDIKINKLEEKYNKLYLIPFLYKEFLFKVKHCFIVRKLNKQSSNINNYLRLKKKLFKLLSINYYLGFKLKLNYIKAVNNKKSLAIKNIFLKLVLYKTCKITNRITYVKKLLKLQFNLFKKFIYLRIKNKKEIYNKVIMFKKYNTNNIIKNIVTLRSNYIVNKIAKITKLSKIKSLNNKVATSVKNYIYKKKYFDFLKNAIYNTNKNILSFIINHQIKQSFEVILKYKQSNKLVKTRINAILKNKMAVNFLIYLYYKILIYRKESSDLNEISCLNNYNTSILKKNNYICNNNISLQIISGNSNTNNANNQVVIQSKTNENINNNNICYKKLSKINPYINYKSSFIKLIFKIVKKKYKYICMLNNSNNLMSFNLISLYNKQLKHFILILQNNLLIRKKILQKYYSIAYKSYLINKIKYKLELKSEYMLRKYQTLSMYKKLFNTLKSTIKIKYLIVQFRNKCIYNFGFYNLVNTVISINTINQDVSNKHTRIFYALLRFRFYAFLSNLFLKKQKSKLISSKTLIAINIKNYNYYLKSINTLFYMKKLIDIIKNKIKNNNKLLIDNTIKNKLTKKYKHNKKLYVIKRLISNKVKNSTNIKNYLNYINNIYSSYFKYYLQIISKKAIIKKNVYLKCNKNKTIIINKQLLFKLFFKVLRNLFLIYKNRNLLNLRNNLIKNQNNNLIKNYFFRQLKYKIKNNKKVLNFLINELNNKFIKFIKKTKNKLIYVYLQDSLIRKKCLKYTFNIFKLVFIRYNYLLNSICQTYYSKRVIKEIVKGYKYSFKTTVLHFKFVTKIFYNIMQNKLNFKQKNKALYNIKNNIFYNKYLKFYLFKIIINSKLNKKLSLKYAKIINKLKNNCKNFEINIKKIFYLYYLNKIIKFKIIKFKYSNKFNCLKQVFTKINFKCFLNLTKKEVLNSKLFTFEYIFNNSFCNIFKNINIYKAFNSIKYYNKIKYYLNYIVKSEKIKTIKKLTNSIKTSSKLKFNLTSLLNKILIIRIKSFNSYIKNTRNSKKDLKTKSSQYLKYKYNKNMFNIVMLYFNKTKLKKQQFNKNYILYIFKTSFYKINYNKIIAKKEEKINNNLKFKLNELIKKNKCILYKRFINIFKNYIGYSKKADIIKKNYNKFLKTIYLKFYTHFINKIKYSNRIKKHLLIYLCKSIKFKKNNAKFNTTNNSNKLCKLNIDLIRSFFKNIKTFINKNKHIKSNKFFFDYKYKPTTLAFRKLIIYRASNYKFKLANLLKKINAFRFFTCNVYIVKKDKLLNNRKNIQNNIINYKKYFFGLMYNKLSKLIKIKKIKSIELKKQIFNVLKVHCCHNKDLNKYLKEADNYYYI